MKILKKLYCLWMVQLLLCALALPVAASAYAEYAGLQVTVTMDKEEYNPGEPITATLSVLNTNNYTVKVMNLEQLIPEGYRLEESSAASVKNATVAPGETLTLQVCFEEEPVPTAEAEMGFWYRLLNGETLGIPNLLLAVIAVIGFVIFMILT